LIHCRGVHHRDFEPKNVLRKGWCRLTIIDFSFSEVDHECLGWRDCDELKDAWRFKLKLDFLAFHRKIGMLEIIRMVSVVVCGSILFHFLSSFIIPSVVLRMVGLPTAEPVNSLVTH